MRYKNVFLAIGLSIIGLLFMSALWWTLIYYSMRQNFVYSAYMLNVPVDTVMSLYAQLEAGDINVIEMLWGLPPGVRGVGLLISLLPFVFFRLAGANHITAGGAFVLILVALLTTAFDIWTNIAGHDILSRIIVVDVGEEGIIRTGSVGLAAIATFSDEGFMLGVEFVVIALGQAISVFRRGGEIPSPFRIVQDTSFGNGFTSAGKFVSSFNFSNPFANRKRTRSNSSNSGSSSPPVRDNRPPSNSNPRAGLTRLGD